MFLWHVVNAPIWERYTICYLKPRYSKKKTSACLMVSFISYWSGSQKKSALFFSPQEITTEICDRFHSTLLLMRLLFYFSFITETFEVVPSPLASVTLSFSSRRAVEGGEDERIFYIVCLFRQYLNTKPFENNNFSQMRIPQQSIWKEKIE